MVAGPPPLDSTYYLGNFERLLDGVEARYGDLLESFELDFLADFRALPRGARCLWVRLAARRGPTFRADRISYSEIDDIELALADLLERGFVDHAANEPAAKVASLLLRREIEEIAGGLDLREHFRHKSDLLAAVLDVAGDERLATEVRRRIRPVRLLRRDEITVFRLLFFGNLRQDWSELVLTDLDLWRYEPYELRVDLRRFETRRAIDDVLAAASLRASIDRLLDTRDLAGAWTVTRQMVTRPHGWDRLSRPSVTATLCEVGRALERAGEPRKAIELYEGCDGPPSRERRARLLEKLDRPYDALALCREITNDSRDEGELLFAPRFAHRIQRRLGQVAATHRTRLRRKSIRLHRDDSERVENQVLAALAKEGAAGFHSENRLWRSLFGLLFWDIVFHPIAGAFEHPYQARPLDLWSPRFRSRREPLIERRLDEIRCGAWSAERMSRLWAERLETRNTLVHWDPLNRQAMETVLGVVPGSDLAYVFDRLSRDLGRYRRGFPDLFVVRDGASSYELLEVKAPGDQLRPEQRGWLDYLTAGGISAHMLCVEWR